MRRNYFLINLTLSITVILMGLKFYDALTADMGVPDYSVRHKPAARTNNPPHSADRAKAESSFDIVSDRNLFHPSRSAIGNATDKSGPAVPKNEFQLFGTTISADTKSALLEDPYTKKTRLYHIDDMIAGHTVSAIYRDKVVLRNGDESIELNLRAHKKFEPPKRIRQRPRIMHRPPPRPRVNAKVPRRARAGR